MVTVPLPSRRQTVRQLAATIRQVEVASDWGNRRGLLDEFSDELAAGEWGNPTVVPETHPSEISDGEAYSQAVDPNGQGQQNGGNTRSEYKRIHNQVGKSEAAEAGLAGDRRRAVDWEKVLPGSRIPRGGMLELLATQRGEGAIALAFWLIQRTSAFPHTAPARTQLVLIDIEHELYPPALANWGVNLARTIVVRPRSANEGIWAFEQALRNPGVTAAWCRSQQWNDRIYRRLQLACEAGGAVALISGVLTRRPLGNCCDLRWAIRPVRNRSTLFRNVSTATPARSLVKEPVVPGSPVCSESATSPASLLNFPSSECLAITENGWPPVSGRRLRVELLQARNGVVGGVVELDLCDESGAVCVVSPVATSATSARTA